jgi:HlyD family secretion protein
VAFWQKITLILLFGTSVVVGTYVGATRFRKPATPTTPAQTVKVQRGNVVSTVSATGNIVYPERVQLGFSISGVLSDISVKVGDAVTAGTVLARLDETSLRDALTKAENDLRVAQLRLQQLQEPPRPEDIQAARLEVANAQASLDKLRKGASEADLKKAEAQVTSAQAAYEKAKSDLEAAMKPDDTAIKQAQADVASKEAALAKAQAALERAQASLASLQQGGSDTKLRAAEANLAKAQSDLQVAQNNVEREKAKLLTEIDQQNNRLNDARVRLEKAQDKYNKDQSSQNRFELEQAQANYDRVKKEVEWEVNIRQAQLGDNPPAGTGMAEKKAQVDNLRIAVQQAQANLENVRASVSTDLANAQRDVENARRALEIARANLDTLLNPSPDKIENLKKSVESAKANWESAQRALESLQAGPSAEDLRVAQNNLARAQLNLQKAQAGPKESDLELQRLQVQQAELNVKSAQYNLSQATLKAPFAGVVAEVTGRVGERPAATFITLVKTDRVEMQAQVDEANAVQLQVGQTATITLDAMPNVRLRGRVATIAPVGVTQQGVVLFPITITLEVGNVTLRSGLTATALIEVARKDNVLVVPNRAIRREGQNQVVSVRLPDGKSETRVVRTGLANDQLSEVVNGLNEGEEVEIRGTQLAQPKVGGGFGGFGGAVPGAVPKVTTK